MKREETRRVRKQEITFSEEETKIKKALKTKDEDNKIFLLLRCQFKTQQKVYSANTALARALCPQKLV